ncbi:type VI secretion system-associated FHA domain protein TagH [Pseudomonas sp. SCB32]|uniref:type VI secretion system-associated FHA domain protein TagH n=1 Tax=Pseudomonas sp. SCB32 TaxID=2653853 RepID=UPI00126589E1|nr:type VI secretion system-associated FHA domain protein TagH [Pseudomonas sp. SCB32]
MKLTVIEQSGQPVDQGVSASFRAPGGIIGSSAGCHLKLNDPEGRISRLQAVLSHRQDGWHVRNAGSALAIAVGPHPLELNQECRLREGELLRIGAFLLRSEASHSMQTPESPLSPQHTPPAASPPQATTHSGSGAPASQENPFADLLGDTPLSTSTTPRPPPLLHLEDSAVVTTQRAWVAPSFFGQLPDAGASLFARQPPGSPAELVPNSSLTGPSMDPLTLFSAPVHHPDLLKNLGPALLPDAQTTVLHQAAIIEAPDRHEIADKVEIGRTALRWGENAPSLPMPVEALAPMPAEEPTLLLDGTLPGTGLTEFAAELAALGASPLASQAPQPSPLATDGFAQAIAPVMADATESAMLTLLPALATPTLAQDESPAALAPNLPPSSEHKSTPVAVEEAPEHSLPRRDSACAASSRRQRKEQAEGDAMAGFMKAAGIGQVLPAVLPLDLRMAQLGNLFKLFTDGTVRLLSSRTLLKREVRAELTRVMDSANNPFKILPSGEAVLIQMFGQHLPGFLPPEQAIRDALEDLQHHQLGVLAGTRSALFELLREFDPRLSETEHAPRDWLDRLLPSRVDSRRWQHYRERFQRLLGLAQSNDFHRLFGDSFQRAYEDEIKRCSAESAERHKETQA